MELPNRADQAARDGKRADCNMTRNAQAVIRGAVESWPILEALSTAAINAMTNSIHNIILSREG